MTFFDYQIGGSLRTNYAKETVNILKDIGSSREVTNPEILKKVYANPLARESLQRKGVELKGSLGFFYMIYIKIYVKIRDAWLCLICLIMSPLSILSGLYAQIYALGGIRSDVVSSNDAMATKNTSTIQELVNGENYDGAIRKHGIEPVKIVHGKSDDLSSCYYDVMHHVVSLPKFILKTAVKKDKTVCKTESGKRFGPISAAAIAFHELGHVEQCKFLRINTGVRITASILGIIIPVITEMVDLTPLVSSILSVVLILIGFVAMSAPIIQFIYERDASERALANLLARGYITDEKEAEEATRTLQLAASTYLINTIISTMRTLSPK
jgi:Zn-dependent membrane protease YugP